MMKKLLLALLLSSSLYAASLYTLDNVHSLNLYFASEAGFLNPEKKTMLKDMATQKLAKAGFALGETDASIFVVKIDALEIKESHAVHIEVGLGEEVTTKRTNKIESFAYTYLDSKFIKTEDPYTQTYTSLGLMIDAFIKAHKEDNE
jgi:hypothetical protein